MTDCIVFLRSQLPRTDSRLQRYLHAIKLFNKKSIVVGWDRCGNSILREHEVCYRKKARIGGGWSNIFSLICWNWFVFVRLWTLRKEYAVIHAADFDTIIPAMLVAKAFKKRVIFDIYDKYTDSRYFPIVLRFIVDKIELLCAMRADILILADECRREQLKIPSYKNLVILENVPAINTSYLTNRRKKGPKRILAYVGILEPMHRGLEDVLKVVSQRSDVMLVIAGNGGLRSVVVEYARIHQNIKYCGAVTPEEAIKILSDCDIQIGLYYRTIRNHLFAAPNKYYEHLMTGKPLVTTNGTPPGLKVSRLNTGYSIDEGMEALQNWLDRLNDNDINIKGKNALDIWRRSYSKYYESIFLPLYRKCLS